MKRLTPNQVVAFNLHRARMFHGWSQAQAATELEPYLGQKWSRVVFSAAERSITGRRIKHFTADEIVAFAQAFDLPISFFFEPPAVDLIAAPKARQGVTPEQLLDLARASADERIAALLDQRIKDVDLPLEALSQIVRAAGGAHLRDAVRQAGLPVLEEGDVIRGGRLESEPSESERNR